MKEIFFPDGSFKKVYDERMVKKEPISQPRNFDQYMDYMRTGQEYKKSTEIYKDTVDIKVKTGGLPFMIMPLSDIHMGNKGVDYEALKTHMDYLKEYPVYTILLGDLADNFGPKIIPDGMMGDVTSPDEQFSSLRAMFKEYQEKILAVVPGNHCLWTKMASGVDMNRWLTEDLNIPLLNAGGIINLQVNEQQYKIMPFHSINRFNSSFNKTHASKRALEFKGDADIVLSGHTHAGSMEKTTHRSHTKPMLVSCGTFKNNDEFQKQQGRIIPTEVFFPTLFLSPDKKNVEAIEDIETAKFFIDSMAMSMKQRAVAMLGMK